MKFHHSRRLKVEKEALLKFRTKNPPPFEKVPGGNQKSIEGPLKRKSLVLYFCVIVQEREKILVLQPGAFQILDFEFLNQQHFLSPGYVRRRQHC